MVQFASYLRRVLCKTRLIFPRINGPNVCLLLMAIQKVYLIYALLIGSYFLRPFFFEGGGECYLK